MLKINDKIKFYYLKQFKDELKGGQFLTDYTTTSEEYSGKIIEVRNIVDSPVSKDTIRRNNIKGHRSEMLYTVELDGDEGIKAFYDGRMVGTEVLPETKRGIWKVMASAFAHLNTKNRSRNQWARITDARSGEVLHTGQPAYIKQVAKKKYNTLLDF